MAPSQRHLWVAYGRSLSPPPPTHLHPLPNLITISCYDLYDVMAFTKPQHTLFPPRPPFCMFERLRVCCVYVAAVFSCLSRRAHAQAHACSTHILNKHSHIQKHTRTRTGKTHTHIQTHTCIHIHVYTDTHIKKRLLCFCFILFLWLSFFSLDADEKINGKILK